MANYTFWLRRRELVSPEGFSDWVIREEAVSCPSAELAVVIVDMWDTHWSSGAAYRSGILARRIQDAASRVRDRGGLVVHAPSDTMAFYEGAPARERFLDEARRGIAGGIPEPVSIEQYPLPIDDSDGGSDTPALDRYPPNTAVWKRQHGDILIDQSGDLICGDEGEELYACLANRGIKFLIYMGVHTNMCILNRSFGIKKMLARGFKTVLVRDLTDAMYNPERPPYVSHHEGTRLVVEYIEKKYCPTIDSAQL
jgi:nicotinamidase-related amidase